MPGTTLLSRKFYTNLGSLYLSVRRKCSSCAAFEVVDSNLLSHGGSSNPQILPGQFSDESKKIIKNRRSSIENLYEKERLKRYSGMLHECASKASLKEGKAVHGQVIRNRVCPDSHLWTSLVNAYSKCHCPEYARRVHDEMPEKDVVSWTASIQGFVGVGNGREGVYLFSEMWKDGIRPNEFTLTVCFKACSICFDLDFGKQVHAEAVKLGFLSDLFVGSALIELYAQCSELELADKVFCTMPETNSVSWNVLLNGYAQGGDSTKVLELFCKITEPEMKLSKFTLSIVLKGLVNSESLREGQMVHSMAIKGGYELDEYIGSTLVDLYSRCELVNDALKVFNRIQEPDVVAWSAIIKCLDQQGESQKAAEQFLRMTRMGNKPNQFSFCSLITVATSLRDLQYGQSIHACIWKHGFLSDISVSSALVTMYMRNGCQQEGASVFKAMTDKDLVAWNSYLSGLDDPGTCDQAPRIFCQILREGFRLDVYTFINVLRSCSSVSNVGFGRQVHAHVVKSKLDANQSVQTSLIDMYVRRKCLEDADLAFKKSSSRDICTWAVIISGHAQNDQAEKSVYYFRQMQRECIKPNEFTIAACLSGCSRMGSLGCGQQLQSLAIKEGHINDGFVINALVDMYAKCGFIEDAEALFRGLVFRDTTLWNTMICGFSRHGQGGKALETFQMMLDEGYLPDEVTYMGILSACSHQGLVEEGKRLFNSMSGELGVAPTMKLLACMIDILGRAQRFDEVEAFINNMKLNPDALIWETVLGASRMHNNVEFGERAAAKLLELQPNVGANYILLSNIYAAKGKWDDVRKVRSLMSNRGVKKRPGCSWFEVNGQVHVFYSNDASHPKIQEIHRKLKELRQKLISVGYVPKTEYVLHDVSETEKGDNLEFHSERLALAFALITTNMKKNHIFKNLRSCGDCHEFMKLMSDITSRELIIRDDARFHHFKNGVCSCQDYW